VVQGLEEVHMMLDEKSLAHVVEEQHSCMAGRLMLAKILDLAEDHFAYGQEFQGYDSPDRIQYDGWQEE
jgi:hypothetical protein